MLHYGPHFLYLKREHQQWEAGHQMRCPELERETINDIIQHFYVYLDDMKNILPLVNIQAGDFSTHGRWGDITALP